MSPLNKGEYDETEDFFIALSDIAVSTLLVLPVLPMIVNASFNTRFNQWIKAR